MTNFKFTFSLINKIFLGFFLIAFLITPNKLISQEIGQGNAPYFNGTSSWINANNLTSIGNNYVSWSLEFWFKAANVQNDPGHVALFANNGYSDAANHLLLLLGKDGVQDGKLYLYASNTVVISDFLNRIDGNAHHVVITYNVNSRYIVLFVDGYEIGATYLSSPISSVVNNQWTIGAEYDQSGLGDYFTGSIDNFRMYSGAKSLRDVRVNKRINSTSESGLLTAIDFNNLSSNIYNSQTPDNYYLIARGTSDTKSEFLVGNGYSDIKWASTNTTLTFSNDVGVTAKITDLYDSQEKAVIAQKYKITDGTKAPDNWDIVGNNIWVIDQHSAFQQTKIQYTFKVDENLTSSNSEPSFYKIYKRGFGLSDTWIEWGSVTDVDYVNDRITTSAITSTYGQFYIARDPNGKIGPYSGTAKSIPGIIQSEEFDFGGEGLAYHDLTTQNAGNQFRPSEGVDIEVCTDIGGGYNVGWTNDDEWMEYTIQVNQTGNYTFVARVSAPINNSELKVTLDGSNQMTATVPNTGGYQSWADVTLGNKFLNAGEHKLRATISKGGFNINYIQAYSGIVSVEDELEIPKDFELSQNYPNPFNPATSIEYTVPSSEYVSLKVYDVLGNEITTLVNEQKNGGTYKVNFNANNLANGLYIYKIQAGSFTQVKKMILLK